ncbi:ATpase [Clostridium aceticum]|uniref:ATpase n=3 Tax=Clostridium aceticum TaxID=84022 RepID=A0A0D8IA41_9CLOT|nr:ATpase [Clostridium aceticum]KJF26887.1 ATPase AAA [Clostridium aceticum]
MIPFKDKKEIVTEEILKKTIVKGFKINEKDSCKVVIKDALFANVEGKEVLLDEPIVNNMLKEIYKALRNNVTKYNQFPKTLVISREDEEVLPQEKNKENSKEESILSFTPRWGMEDVYVNEEEKLQIQSALAMVFHREKLFDKWGLKKIMPNGRASVFNFYGPPGTGKSMMAEAIAHKLGKKLFLVNYAELESKYVGETPKNIRNLFKKAIEEDGVLVFDEADSFLGKRLTSVSQSADYGVNITRSVMLLEIERFDGVIIFTTNLLSNYDEAFKRRILASVEFRLPNEEGRKKIWETHLPQELPLSAEVTKALLAKKYEDISGADIKDMILYAAVISLENRRETVEIADFDQAYQYIKKRYTGMENFKINHEVITQEEYEKEIAKLQ